MRKHKDTYQLFILMIVISLLISLASIVIIYKLVYKEKGILLHELCANQTDIIKSIYNETNDVNAVLNVLLKQRDITSGMGTTGEFTMGYIKNDSIVFTIRSRQKIQTKYIPISLKSNLAIPLKYALSKNTGFIQGLDYKGIEVLSYCTYIPELQWGIVSKMNVSEIRLPFYKAGIYALLSSLILILITTIIFRKISHRITKIIIDSEENYRRIFEYSAIPIWKADYSDIKKFFDFLKYTGVTDYRTYFEEHKEEANHLVSQIKIIEINQKNIEFFEEESTEHIINNMLLYYTKESYDVLREEMIALAEGATKFECEMTIQTLFKETKTISLHLSVVSGFENTLSNILISFIDITERKNNEVKLCRSRKDWMETFDLIPDMITILDNQQRIVRVNKALTDKLGVSPQDIIGLPCYQCIHETHEAPLFCPHEMMLKDGKEHIIDFYEAKFKMDLLVSVTPIYDNNGNLTGSVHVAHDITERKRKERELNKLNRTLSTLSKSSHEMTHAKDEVMYLDKVCKIIIDNCGYTMVWIGYAETDTNKTVKPIAYSGFEEGYMETLNITWSDTERGNGPTGLAIRTGKPTICKNMLTDPAFEPWRNDALKRGYASSMVLPLIIDNKTFGAISIYSKEPDSFINDEIALLSELANDLAYGIISIRSRIAQKEAKELLTNSESRYRRLFESAKDGILILDADTGMIVDVNPFLIELLGYSKEQFIKKEIWEIGFLKDIVANKDKFSELQQKEYIRYENLPLKTFDGRVINVEFVSNIYLVNQQKVIQCNIRDITERKIVEKELEEKKVKLEESIASKDKFFKIIAHDMKNPFVSLLGASELLYENAHKYEITKIVKLTKLLNDSAKSGYDMLINLLEWARSQAGSMLFQPEKIYLKELIDNNLSNLIDFASSKKITLNFDITNNIQVYADKNMLETILRNLINNALKFTSKYGEVTVSVKIENDSVIILVKDTGVGIANNDLDKLFRTDIKYSNPGTEHEGGTGLGLLLCKELVEKHGGKLWVESELKKGSTFYFKLCSLKNCK